MVSRTTDWFPSAVVRWICKGQPVSNRVYTKSCLLLHCTRHSGRWCNLESLLECIDQEGHWRRSIHGIHNHLWYSQLWLLNTSNSLLDSNMGSRQQLQCKNQHLQGSSPTAFLMILMALMGLVVIVTH